MNFDLVAELAMLPRDAGRGHQPQLPTGHAVTRPNPQALERVRGAGGSARPRADAHVLSTSRWAGPSYDAQYRLGVLNALWTLYVFNLRRVNWDITP